MSAHTPGPFTVGQLCNGTIRIDEPERCAGMVFVEPAALGGPDGLARAEATARLWAASADLLAALKDTVRELAVAGRRPMSDSAKDAYRAGMAAIARAEGRS